MKSATGQRIIFVEPHGLAHGWSGGDEDKIGLADRIKDMERALKPHHPDITLDSYIISVTTYAEAKPVLGNRSRADLEQKHILFQQDDPEYVRKIFAP